MSLLQPVVLLISVWLPVFFLALRWLPLTGSGRYLFCLGASGIIALISSGAVLWAGLVMSGQLLSWLPTVFLAALSLIAVFFKPQSGPRVEGNQSSLVHAVPIGFFAKALFGLLSLLICLRVVSLSPDVLLRPLFAWDAWTVWGYEARLWLESGGYVELVPPGEWLTAPAGEFLRDTLVVYPKLVPALIMWVVPAEAGWTGVGPGILWLSLLACIALVLAGTVRLAGAGPIWALGSAYVFISLPLVNAHVALYGYADLWIAAVLSVFAGLLVIAERDSRRLWLVLAVLVLGALPLLKIEGSYWLVCGLVTLLVMRLGLGVRSLVVLAGLATAGVLGAAAAGLDVLNIATLGRLSVSIAQLGDALAGGARHAFVWFDWHLLIFTAVAALAMLVWRPELGLRNRRLNAFVVLGFVILWGFTPLTGAGQFLSQGTLFSRIILQFSPAIILLVILVFWQMSSLNSNRTRSSGSETGFGLVIAAALGPAFILWAAFSGWLMTDSGSGVMFPKLVLEPEPESWRMVEGQGEWTEQSFKVLAPGRFGRVELAIDLPVGLRASDYERVAIRFGDQSPSNLALGWSASTQYRVSAQVSLESEGFQSAIAQVGSNRAWRDPLYFLSIEQIGFTDGPWTIESIEMQPGSIGLLRAQRLLWDSFYGNLPWVQRNPHFLWPIDPVPRISPVIALAAWGLMCVFLLGLSRRSRSPLNPGFLLLPLCVGWMVLDLRWQIELGHKAYATVSTFAGHAPIERFSSDLDGSLYDFLQKLQESHERSDFGRIFALSEVEFWRKRARYHLAAWGARPVDAGLLGAGMAAGLQPDDLLLFLRATGLDMRPVASEEYDALYNLKLESHGLELLGEKPFDEGDWMAFKVIEIRTVTQ